MNRVLIPPPATAAGRMAVYRTTYYPAASTAGAATVITLEGGEERTDVTIALRPVPAVRVSGRLVTPEGSPPPPTSIRLVGDAMADVITRSASGIADAGFETVNGMTDAGGRFTLLGVPAGRVRPQEREPRLGTPPDRAYPHSGRSSASRSGP